MYELLHEMSIEMDWFSLTRFGIRITFFSFVQDIRRELFFVEFCMVILSTVALLFIQFMNCNRLVIYGKQTSIDLMLLCQPSYIVCHKDTAPGVFLVFRCYLMLLNCTNNRTFLSMGHLYLWHKRAGVRTSWSRITTVPLSKTQTY